MADVNRLVFSIIQFLHDQKRNAEKDEEQIESIEVAIQCLESAYSINSEDEATKTRYTVSQNLQDIFTAEVGVEQAEDISTLSLHEPTAEEKLKAEELKNQGNDFMKNEQFTNALECYSQALKLDGKNSVYYCNRAAAYSKLGNHKAAIEDCHKALQIDPLYSKAYGRMGIAYTALEDHESALECYRKALELEPGNQSYQNNLEIAEQKLQEQAARSGFMMPDMGAMMSNPALMSMAQNMMSNPQMQEMMANMMSGANQEGGGGGGGQPGVQGGQGGQGGMGINSMLQMGQQLAQQLQDQNPDLVNQLRQQLGRPPNPGAPENQGDSQQPPQSEGPGGDGQI